jgi:hypothetical protein
MKKKKKDNIITILFLLVTSQVLGGGSIIKFGGRPNYLIIMKFNLKLIKLLLFACYVHLFLYLLA